MKRKKAMKRKPPVLRRVSRRKKSKYSGKC